MTEFLTDHPLLWCENMSWVPKILTAAAALLVVVTVCIWFFPDWQAGSLLKPNDAVVVAQGKEIYAANCASCHGVDLEGEPNWRRPNADLTMPAPPHDEKGHTWHHTDKTLFELTKYGLGKITNNSDYKTNMPVYDGVLKDEEIVAVLSFIKSRWPVDIRKKHNELNLKSK